MKTITLTDEEVAMLIDDCNGNIFAADAILEYPEHEEYGKAMKYKRISEQLLKKLKDETND